jgi:signal transduction histidine kinase
MDLWGVKDEEELEALKASWCILEDEQITSLGLMPLVKRAFGGEQVALPEFEYDAGPAFEAAGLPVAGAKKRWVRSHLYPVLDANGEIRNVVDVEEDITDLKTADRKLQEYQERLRGLGMELTISEERERRRIATELHDNAAQSLSLARLRLAAAVKGVGDDAASSQLEDVSQLLKDSLQQIRELVLDLSSPALEEIGLAAATSEWLEDHLRHRHGLQTSFTNRCGDFKLEDDVLSVLFRNTRELLTNVVKHARATRVSVRFDCIDDVLRITVADDGRGFAASGTERKPNDKGGFGLFSIRERMADLGGGLEIESVPGMGCTARLTLPQEYLRERG